MPRRALRGAEGSIRHRKTYPIETTAVVTKEQRKKKKRYPVACVSRTVAIKGLVSRCDVRTIVRFNNAARAIH